MLWYRLPREVVESLKLFRSCEDVALGDIVGVVGGGLAVGLDDLGSVFQTYDSVSHGCR